MGQGRCRLSAALAEQASCRQRLWFSTAGFQRRSEGQCLLVSGRRSLVFGHRSTCLPRLCLLGVDQRRQCFGTEASAASSVDASTGEAEQEAADDGKPVPPWLQRKPWRWDPPEEESDAFMQLTLPNTQVAERFRTPILLLLTCGTFFFYGGYWWAPPENSTYLDKHMK
mmetsp:Transcript_37862/g.85310  ORF Transcript_37862/g.85310 Transcript_37862/m.85310 type:complete len:169 (+) Transcript_37862:69-575(+)